MTVVAKKKRRTKEEILADWESNPMRRPFLEKVVAHIAVGAEGEPLLKAGTVLEELSGQKSVFRRAKRSIKEFGIRKKQNIAAMVTLRGERAKEFLRRAIFVKDNRVLRKSFDDFGNFSIGIQEHITIPGVRYNPELGIFGLHVHVHLERPGCRVKRRRKFRQKIGKNHHVRREETMLFMEREFNAEIVDKMVERYY
ncbi:MAG: 50S ribosomal protein L5 [Promethearchaeota archaeon]